ncbi:MAG: lipoate--protein ligase family protein [Planctomycetes bacterium]|nr:lipoate--protein ligase family protein [Planctomycetota bacterium]
MPPESGLLLLDLSLAAPEENLALDEALLLRAEAGLAEGRPAGACEVLRLWESPVHFVALGVSSRLEADVDEDACALEGVPVLRRSSGGGTVLQGPGCLNFALVLSLEARPELGDVSRSYRAILERVAAALGVPGLAMEGTSDLAAGTRKVSGNAQKRTRRALLHHGTVLHGIDAARVARLLREPAKQPGYRARRPHGDFIASLDMAPAEIKARIARAWGAAPPADPFPLPDLAELVRRKYADPGWTRRF